MKQCYGMFIEADPSTWEERDGPIDADLTLFRLITREVLRDAKDAADRGLEVDQSSLKLSREHVESPGGPTLHGLGYHFHTLEEAK